MCQQVFLIFVLETNCLGAVHNIDNLLEIQVVLLSLSFLAQVYYIFLLIYYSMSSTHTSNRNYLGIFQYSTDPIRLSNKLVLSSMYLPLPHP